MELRYPAPGTVVVGKYAIEALLGEGGMGAVLKARHLGLDRRVAIKCLLPELLGRADIVARFMREARAAVTLKGEHVARRALPQGEHWSDNSPARAALTSTPSGPTVGKRAGRPGGRRSGSEGMSRVSGAGRA